MASWPEHHHSCRQLLSDVCSWKKMLAAAMCSATCFCCCRCRRVAQVCVGATCPEARLHLLLPLLEPSGGKLLAPVDNDLRLYSRGPDGKLRQRVVSSVRFSDLEVR